jgi:hypothetical protein
MSLHQPNPTFPTPACPTSECKAIRAEFSDYLDGAVSGVAMAAIAGHLEACAPCEAEFAALRTIQQTLAELGHAASPIRLQAQLRATIAAERARGTHLSPVDRFRNAWQTWLAPATVRVAGGMAVAVMLVGTLGWMFAAPLAVQANDDNLSHLVGPRFLYSEVPPQPISMDRDTPILVEAKVDTAGRVYDYSIVAGPTDPAVRLRVEANLLSSIFKPATLFGTPVRGQVVLTYTGVSVRG